MINLNKAIKASIKNKTTVKQEADKLPKSKNPKLAPKPAIKPNPAVGLAQLAQSAQGVKPVSKDGMNFLNRNQNPNFQGLLGQLNSRLPKPPTTQAPAKPLGQAQPLQANQPEQPVQSPSVPFKESIIQQPEPAAPAQPEAPVQPATPAPAPAAPQVVGPAAQMQAQKDQMFPPAPAAPVAPKPAQVTPPAGVTKSQAEIDEEKKKQAAGMAGMAKTASGSF